VAISPPTHGAALPAKPTTTDSIPSLTDLTTQATTKHEPRLCATPLNTAGSAWKAHDSTIRGLLITSSQAILTLRFCLRIAVAIRVVAMAPTIRKTKIKIEKSKTKIGGIHRWRVG